MVTGIQHIERTMMKKCCKQREQHLEMHQRGIFWDLGLILDGKYVVTVEVNAGH